MKTRTRRTVAFMTAIPLVFLAIGVSGTEARAAPPEEEAQTVQLTEEEPGLAGQKAYELWLNTLAETVDRDAYSGELAAWKTLYSETSESFSTYMQKDALYTAVAANTAARKAEAVILDGLKKIVLKAKESLDQATHDDTVVLRNAWEEQVEVKPDWDETVREAWDETVREAYDETVEVEPAWDEPVYEYFAVCARCGYMTQDSMTIIVHCQDAHEAEGGARYSVEPVQTGSIRHEAVTQVVHHDAVVVHHNAEIVHHDPEYTTVHHDAEMATVPHDNSGELADYEEAVEKANSEAGPIEGLEGLDLEAGFITVINNLDGKIAEKQAEIEQSEANEAIAKADGEAAESVYLEKKALCDAAFAALKEAVAKAVDASFLVPEGEYYIFNGTGGNNVIDIKSGSMENDATARLYTYNKTDAQKFRVVHNDDGTVTLLSARSGKALDAAGGGILPRTNVQQYAVNGLPAQKWVLTDPDGDGLLFIRASYVNLYVDTRDGVAVSGTNVHLFTPNGSATQEWRFADPVSVFFIDVADPDKWYYGPVYWAFENNITSGYGKDTFQPNAKVTRAQVVNFLYNLAGKPSVEGQVAERFADVPDDKWYYAAVTWASANHITDGYGPGTFQPDKTCTRAMIAKFLRQYAGYIGESTGLNELYESPKFADVHPDAWYYQAVLWAAENGLTEGYGTGIFQPNASCSRAMMVTFLQRAEEAWAA